MVDLELKASIPKTRRGFARRCWALSPVTPPVAVMVLLAAGGCATPAGALFPAIDPPKAWPAAPDPPRIHWLGMIAGSDDLKPGRSAAEAFATVLRGPRPPIRFLNPQSVAIRPPGLLAVTDGTGGAVHLLDLDERTHVVVYGSAEERFGAPMGATWAGDRLFITDAERHEVVELNTEGNWQRRFGGDLLIRPVGIAYVAQREAIYVVDGGGHRVLVFGLNGEMEATLGGRGTGPGEFNFPTYIGILPDRILVSDSGNFRVQCLDFDGSPLATMGKKGNAAGDLSLPKGIAADRDGHFYVVDAHFENVQIFDENGGLLMAFGEEGSGRGEFSLPAGIAIDGQDRIWVADAGNRRVQVFVYRRTSS